MADDKKEATIVIKRIKKGGHGAHGGAWKVAFADFMTAMMAFFLVMWLMGSDEETKSAVSHYFNNPSSAWRKEVATPDVAPLGDLTGAGENVVKGANGQTPDDLLERPARPIQSHDLQGSKPGEILAQFLSDDSIMSLDQLKFSVPEAQIFKKGTLSEWSENSGDFFKKLGLLCEKYKGKLQIRSSYKSAKPGESVSSADTYEYQLNRVVAIAKHASEQRWTREDWIQSLVTEDKRSPASEESSERRFEFTLTRVSGK